MKCKVCGHAMTLLFTSWACDYCEGKIPEVSSKGYARVQGKDFWVALFDSYGQEISGDGYCRVRIKMMPSSNWADAFSWKGETVFPAATGHWDVAEAALMGAESGGKPLMFIALGYVPRVNSGDTLRVTVATSSSSLP